MSDLSFLAEVLIFLAAAIVVATVFQHLRISLVLGYLVAGALIGPNLAGLVADSATTRGIAELGVIFLLFTIGLDLSIERLRIMRAQMLRFGGGQIAITGTVAGLAAAYAGATMESAVLIGGGLALSSTAVVIEVLSERGELASRAGRIGFSVLIAQDLAVVPLLALVTVLAEPGEAMLGTVLFTIVQAAAAVALLVVLGRLALRPLFRSIAVHRTPELFAAMTLFVLLGTAAATHAAGLSLAMGGFVAGLLLAETEFRHQVYADIQPFRGLLLGLFFMTVGMSVDLGFALAHAREVALILAGLVFVKAAILVPLCRALGQPLGVSVQVGLLLAQGGEFGFALFGLAMLAGVVPREIGDLLVIAIALSMAVTPLLAALGRRASEALTRAAQPAGAPEDGEMRDHVVVCGFGRVGQSVCKTLSAAGVRWVALEFEPTRVAEARAQGLPVFYGDASRPEVLRAAGIERARAAVIIMDNATAAERAVYLLHQMYPRLKIIVRARDSRHRRRLAGAGATTVVHETFEMSLQLGGAALRSIGVDDEAIHRVIGAMREEDYAALNEVIMPTAAEAEALRPHIRSADSGG